jgi:plastocyanin
VNKDTEKCGTEAVIEKVVVGGNKGLANAVVSVPGAKGAAKAVKATVDQHGCKFVPHVTVMTPGELDLKNSDDILHNIHTYSTANPSINKAQPKFKKVMTEKFEKPEMIKLTCDVHSWMLGWVAVMPSPFFGVTDANGVTKIDNVPPGKYTVEAWHETLGKQAKDVEVKAGQTAKVAFEMKK